MAMAVAQHRESSSSGSIEKHLDSGKYVRYTAEQVEALERVYAECPKPSSLRRQQLIRECPILSNIEPKQIKVWFQNRRCREKQRKEASRLQTVNRKLTAMNKLLMEENDRLQKQVSQLVCENGYMRQQLHSVSVSTWLLSIIHVMFLSDYQFVTLLIFNKNKRSILNVEKLWKNRSIVFSMHYYVRVMVKALS